MILYIYKKNAIKNTFTYEYKKIIKKKKKEKKKILYYLIKMNNLYIVLEFTVIFKIIYIKIFFNFYI